MSSIKRIEWVVVAALALAACGRDADTGAGSQAAAPPAEAASRITPQMEMAAQTINGEKIRRVIAEIADDRYGGRLILLRQGFEECQGLLRAFSLNHSFQAVLKTSQLILHLSLIADRSFCGRPGRSAPKAAQDYRRQHYAAMLLHCTPPSNSEPLLGHALSQRPF